MSSVRALAPIERGNWQVMVEQAATLVKSGFLPAHIKTAEQAVAVMLTGQELGIPTMTALRTVTVIQGKVALAAELMAALIERDYGASALRVETTDDTQCTVSYCKPGWHDRKTYSFTIADAKRADLSGANWQKYPAAMLRARCISAVAKMAFQATLGGIYTPEEMGADVTVTEDGEVVYEPAAAAPPAQLAAVPPSEDTPLDDEDAQKCRAFVRKHGWQGDEMQVWMAHHNIRLWSEMTVGLAREMCNDAKARRRPWEGTPAEGERPAHRRQAEDAQVVEHDPFDADELAAMDAESFEESDPDGAA